MPAFQKHDAVAHGSTAKGMRGRIAFAIGFDFNNLSNEQFSTDIPNNVLAEKVASNLKSGTKIE